MGVRVTTQYLTDSEVAVTIDSLEQRREAIRIEQSRYAALPIEPLTPNLDGALAKINGMMTPSTNGLYLTDECPVEIDGPMQPKPLSGVALTLEQWKVLAEVNRDMADEAGRERDLLRDAAIDALAKVYYRHGNTAEQARKNAVSDLAAALDARSGGVASR